MFVPRCDESKHFVPAGAKNCLISSILPTQHVRQWWLRAFDRLERDTFYWGEKTRRGSKRSRSINETRPSGPLTQCDDQMMLAKIGRNERNEASVSTMEGIPDVDWSRAGLKEAEAH